MPIKPATVYEWTGSTGTNSATKLNINSNIWLGKIPVLDFTSYSAAGGAGYTYEHYIGLRLLQTHTKITNARITKVHGSLEEHTTLKAGATTSFVTPVNTASSIATTAIPTHFKPTTELTIDFDSTLNEYQFLVLQYNMATGVTAFNPLIQEGQAGYPLIQIAFDYEQRDATRTSLPGAKAPESVYNRTGTNVFIVDDNGDMQLMGCFDNAMNFNGSPEWISLVKGAMQGADSYALNNRNISLTGTIYSQGTYVLEKLMHGDNYGSDGRHTEVVLDTEWKPVETHEIMFVTYSDEGREMIIRFPNAAIRATGEIAYGQDNTNIPFEIMCNQARMYVSDNLMDVHYFVPNFTITA